MPSYDRPIAAISTAPGNAAIGLVRLSGQGAHDIALRAFRPLGGKRPAVRTAQPGTVFDETGDLDFAVLTCWRGPASYTGEDMAEFSCHGGRVVLESVLAALVAQGAHPAAPGEFTKRAFLNGKMDLAESEAVIDLIMATSRAAAKNALGQTAGALSARLADIRRLLLTCDADIMAFADFFEEGVAPPDTAALVRELETAQANLQALLATCARGRVVAEGAVTVLLGKPNVGKSSLLNLLCGMDRAIVTDTPGTTRDVVEQQISLGGLLLRLRDTAGIRPGGDAIEAMGVQRSLQALEEAALVLAVFDGASPPTEQDRRIAALCEGRCAIALLNKCDLAQAEGYAFLRGAFSAVLPVSAITGEGLPRLEAAVSSLLLPEDGETLLTNLRHERAVREASDCVADAIGALAAGVPPDLAEVDIRRALRSIDAVTGASTSEDVIADIFSRFCVGK